MTEMDIHSKSDFARYILQLYEQYKSARKVSKVANVKRSTILKILKVEVLNATTVTEVPSATVDSEKVLNAIPERKPVVRERRINVSKERLAANTNAFFALCNQSPF